MPDAEIRGLVASRRWDELMKFDQVPMHVACDADDEMISFRSLWQLSNELRSGHTFDGWKEGLITFPPTYKYESNSNRYVGDDAREGEKRRSPAWYLSLSLVHSSIFLCFKGSQPCLA